MFHVNVVNDDVYPTSKQEDERGMKMHAIQSVQSLRIEAERRLEEAEAIDVCSRSSHRLRGRVGALRDVESLLRLEHQVSIEDRQ